MSYLTQDLILLSCGIALGILVGMFFAIKMQIAINNDQEFLSEYAKVYPERVIRAKKR